MPAAASWYKLVVDVSQMLDPGTHFEFRTEFSIDGGATWIEYGGGGRDGGLGRDKQGNPLATCAFFTGQSADTPDDDPLPGTGLPSSQRRARASLVTSGGTFTLGPITLWGGTVADSPPATT